MMTGLALHCSIPEFTKFDRKNYPYPDLMKGYQISQYDLPLALDGYLEIDGDPDIGHGQRRIGVERVHLEEDVAKMQHFPDGDGGAGYSLVDVNRSGVPLMEVVSKPDLRSPEEARQYLTSLHSLVQYLGVSTANMQDGNFRCDANVSIRPVGSQYLRHSHRGQEHEQLPLRVPGPASSRWNDSAASSRTVARSSRKPADGSRSVRSPSPSAARSTPTTTGTSLNRTCPR